MLPHFLWWMAGASAVLLLGLAVFLFAPARAVVEIDTANAVACMRMRPLWGVAPEMLYGAEGRRGSGAGVALLRRWRDTRRIAHALMLAPKLIGPVRRLLSDINALKPQASRMAVNVNGAHPIANLVIDLAAGIPKALLFGLDIQKRETVGLDIIAHLELDAAPLKLFTTYNRFKRTPAVQEFARRLRREKAPT